MCSSLWDTLRARPTSAPCRSVMYGTRRCELGRCTFTLFGSLLGLIHLAVGLPMRIKGCYVRPLQELRTCFGARCDLSVGLILAPQFSTRSSEQLVGVSQRAQPSPEPDAVALRQNALVWTLPDMNKYNAKRVCPSTPLSGESRNKFY